MLSSLRLSTLPAMILAGGVYIDSGVLATILTILLTGIVGLITWLVKQSNLHAVTFAHHAEVMKSLSDADDRLQAVDIDHGERLRNLEAWRNGMEYGRAVGESTLHDRPQGGV